MSGAVRRLLLKTGPDIVVNGGFDADATWTKGAGWTIGSGVASFTATGSASNLSQNIGLVAGGLYRLQLDLTVAAGGVLLVIGISAQTAGVLVGGPVTWVTRAAGDAVLYIQANTTFTGTVDNVSCRRIG